MNICDTYYLKIDEIINVNKDEKKIPSINTYLKNNAEIVYGIPMKKLKSLFAKYLNELSAIDAYSMEMLIKKLFISKAFEKQVTACMLLEKSINCLNISLPDLFLEYVENNIIINWAVADQTALYSLSQVQDKSFVLNFARHNHYLVRRSSVVTFAEMQLNDNDVKYLQKCIMLLLQEKDEYVLRAAGWSIRNIYNYNRNIYFDFLNDYGLYMPRIMLRYSIEMLEEDTRLKILNSSKERRDNMYNMSKQKKKIKA